MSEEARYGGRDVKLYFRDNWLTEKLTPVLIGSEGT